MSFPTFGSSKYTDSQLMLSTSHIKKIKSLHQKKFRKEYGLFLAEGEKIVGELIRSDLEIVEMYATMEFQGAQVITNKELTRISSLKNPNKVLAVARIPGFVANPSGSAILLDGVNDPGNLGTIIRIADWYGIDQVICSPDCADCYNPKVVQATMGSLFRVKLVYTDLEAYLSNSDLDSYAAVMNGDLIQSPAPSNGFNLIMGSESHGIRQDLDQLADHRVTINRVGVAESLNVGVATGIILDRLTGN